MFLRTKCRFFLLLTLVLPLSCTLSYVSEGTPLNRAQKDLLRPGMNKARVLALLGPPNDMGLRMKGSIFIYRYHDESEEAVKVSAYQASVSYKSSRSSTDRLVVLFDKKGRVTAVGIDHARRR
jgi:outer membrane protein assembly factor BamE (lipoprotein component of BamABCDE complex)